MVRVVLDLTCPSDAGKSFERIGKRPDVAKYMFSCSLNHREEANNVFVILNFCGLNGYINPCAHGVLWKDTTAKENRMYMYIILPNTVRSLMKFNANIASRLPQELP
jgi:hypothetical protein